MVPPFPERVHFIIRHAFNLRYFEYIAIDDDPSSNYSVRLLRTCITALEWSERKPTLSIITRRPILGNPLYDLLLYINERFSVTTLDVQSEGTQDNSLLQFLAGFHQVQHLVVWNFRFDESEHDMDRFLGHLSLHKLTVHDTEHVASFPHQLNALEIQHHGTIHTNSVWAATCNLTRLTELYMDCEDTEEWRDEHPIIFKSANLQTLSGTLTARTEEILKNQIIQPIFTSCHQLTSLELYINSPLSSNFLALLLSKETLVDVELSSTASPYTFQEFVGLSKTLPNLERLRLPWPASIGIPTNDDEGTIMDWRYVRDNSQDIPERLTFEQCQILATKYPKLNEIVFEMNTEALCSRYWTWYGPLHDIMPFNPANVEADKIRRDQSFKMATFVDEESPCMNICSVFVCPFPGISSYAMDEEAGWELSMTLFLYLILVRRHATKRYQLLGMGF